MKNRTRDKIHIGIILFRLVIMLAGLTFLFLLNDTAVLFCWIFYGLSWGIPNFVGFSKEVINYK